MNKLITIISLTFIMIACSSEKKEQSTQKLKIKAQTTSIKYGYIPDYLELTGKVVYLNKNSLVSPIDGYITKLNIQEGDFIEKNQIIYEIQTPEGYLVKKSDSLTKKDIGIVKVIAPSSGQIVEIKATTTGIFVNKGVTLCKLLSQDNIKIQINVPFEYKKWIKIGKKYKIALPDSSMITGRISKILPEVNTSTQTIKVLANINTKKFLPENMIVKVLIDKGNKQKTQILPKICVQTDVLMKKFWVMKLINDSTAVQTYVKVGTQNTNEAEIISPQFNPTDKFISVGSYGLEDTVLIDIQQ